MLSWLKSLPKYVYILAGAAVLLAVLALIAWQPLRVLSLQARAGKRIEGYIQESALDYENFFTCQIPALAALTPDERLDQAVALLEKAQALRPTNSQTNLLLGRAHCLQADYASAAAAFEGYDSARQGNPLGAFEAAFAHFTAALTAEGLSDEERASHEEKSRAILAELGYSGDYFFQEGEAAYNRWPVPAYPVAWYWYRLSAIFTPLPEEAAFLVAILDLAFKGHTGSPEVIQENFIFSLDENLTLPPTALFRFEDGSPVKVENIGNRQAGLFFGRKDIGGVLLDVQNESAYCLTVNALDRPPEPTQLEITLDFKTVMLVDLPDGDGSWKTFTTEVPLAQGRHLLGVRLANDDTVNSVDRNGHLGEIVLEACPD